MEFEDGPFPLMPLTVCNRQRKRQVNLRLFRQIGLALLNDLHASQPVELGVNLIGAAEMQRLNETFLRHEGSTDVITFDYADHASRITHHPAALHGEIFLCVDEAILQAHRFRTTWQSELVRYLIHGVLHLLGHDDHHAVARRRMKREENRLLKSLSARFALSRLARKSKLRP
jgi:probable rRNA maturation factor